MNHIKWHVIIDNIPTARKDLVPGTDAFNEAKDRITSDGNLTSKTDASKIYHSDFNYNFKND